MSAAKDDEADARSVTWKSTKESYNDTSASDRMSAGVLSDGLGKERQRDVDSQLNETDEHDEDKASTAVRLAASLLRNAAGNDLGVLGTVVSILASSIQCASLDSTAEDAS